MKKIILILISWCLFSSNVSAQCTISCSLGFAYYTNGVPVPLSTTTPTNFTCGQQIIDISNNLYQCVPGVIVKSGGIYDASNNLVSWSPVHSTTNNTNSLANGGNFAFPTNVLGTFYIKYKWGTAAQDCGTVTYPITLSCSGSGSPCPSCNFTGSYMPIPPNGTSTNLIDGGIYNVLCNTQYEGDVSVVCQNPANPVVAPVFRNQAGQVVSSFWSGGIFNFTTAGTYTATYYKTDASGNKCDSMTVTFNVTCPASCPCPTVGIQKVNNGGHCAMKDTIKNPCNKNIVSWTLKVNGNNYSDLNHPLIPQTIAANATVITGIVGLISLPQTTIPLVYTFTYADGTTCTVTKQFNAANCVPILLPCPTCNITTTATFQGQTTNLNNSTVSNPAILKCNNTYTLKNTISCTPNQNYTFKGAYVSDNFNQNWPVTFNNTGTQLLLPSNMIAGRLYTLTLTWNWIRAVGDTCWASKNYPFRIDCSPCGSVCTPTVDVLSNGTTFTLTAGGNYSNNFDCGKTYTFTPKLNCVPANGNIVISRAKLFDNLTNPIPTPPSWLQVFINNHGTGSFTIPANATAGMYKVRYYYQNAANPLCKDSFTCIMNIVCIPDCNFTANAGPDKIICRGTSTTIGATVLTPNGETYSWTSSPASTIPNTSMPTVSPTVTTTYTLTVTKPNCPPKTDVVVVTVNDCSCSCQSAINCATRLLYKDENGATKRFSCNGTITAKCNKLYSFVPEFECTNNCVATVSLEVTDPTGNPQTYSNISATNPANITFSSTGNYSCIYRFYINGVECSKCYFTVNTTCPPPPCTPCTVKLTSNSRDTLLSYQGITSLVQAFTFTNLPANITEVRATVTNFTLTSVDANGKVNDECSQCNTNATTWASVWGGDKIDGIKPKANINGVETPGNITLPQMTPNKNPRHAVWSNNAAILNVPNTIKVGFFLPAKSTLSCCTNKANICVKFVFRNDKCEECVVNKCFDVVIDK